MSILAIENLSVILGQNKVLDNCNFELDAGEIIVVLGASGDGKSTLLKTIAGLIPKKSGFVKFQGENVPGPDEKLLPGHDRIKLIHQDFNLADFHTVEENIALRLLQYDEAYKQHRVLKLLRLTKLTKYKAFRANELSGGQKQRLAIARALADEPELVLLDEPFNQLDFPTKATIASHIRAYLKRSNIAAIMVTHNGIEAMEWADKVVLLNKGKIERVDTPDNFYNQPENLHQARFFGEINKVKIEEKKIYFRPEAYRLKKNKQFSIKLTLTFIRQENLGWYSVYHFKSGQQKIKLYSTTDISIINEIFVKRLEIND
ncbi:ABC transporter ATP-binding protein [Crocinitomix catalasitica]|uniref:ABC transporter ATP-binding protein n=1 Tax=Crocinitomix catalasitica TaxID=184607 RepID=UPI0006870488|nr:ABC transporter ATP-binding protein [Crocinitomix catalasitica]